MPRLLRAWGFTRIRRCRFIRTRLPATLRVWMRGIWKVSVPQPRTGILLVKAYTRRLRSLIVHRSAPCDACPMATPRSELICLDATHHYHAVGRCVRRAFLCGVDRASGCSFEHRRQWAVDRIALLAKTFAIDVLAYAIMSNHYHLVLRVNPEEADAWSSDEVIERWSALFGVPPVVAMAANENASPAVFKAASDAIKLQRRRLCDLSWFMKCLAGFVLLHRRHTRHPYQ